MDQPLLRQEYIKDYYRLVKSLDDNVARVLDYLEQSGLAKNTLVIYTSDQGFFLGEHGFYNKCWMYEPGLHQPLIVRFLGGITPEQAGFDTHCLWNYPGTTRQRYWNPSLIRDGEVLSFTEDDYGPKLATDFLIDFITGNKDKPFLAYYPMILPHSPFLPTPDSVNRQETNHKTNFVDMVQYADKCVGRIEDALVQLGLREQTLVIFTGDNGTNDLIHSELNGVHVRGAKGYTRDHGTHVPLIVNLPGVIPEAQVNDDLICFSDFFATMVEAAGLPPKEIDNGDGWSFWPQCLGKAGTRREWMYGYYFPRPYAKNFDDKSLHYEVRYARDNRYKLYDNGKLYDTRADVLEQQPIVATEELMRIQQKLQSVLDQYPRQSQAIDYQRVKGKYVPKRS